jgi:hypothetical protein
MAMSGGQFVRERERECVCEREREREGKGGRERERKRGVSDLDKLSICKKQ